MLNIRLKRQVDLVRDPPDLSIRGIVRLWRQETGEPTDLYIVVGDDLPGTYGEAVRGADISTFEGARLQVFARARVTIQQYAPRSGRCFVCDIFVPSALVDAYVG